VLYFRRPGGWQSVTNFGSRAVPRPDGTVVVASSSLHGDLLPADTTVWLIPLVQPDVPPPDHSPALKGERCCD